jgi:chromosome segregation ATPase
MAKAERQLDELRERLTALLADWGTEISAVMAALESQQSLADTHVERVQELQNQVNELAKLKQRIRERDLALDHLTAKSKEKDARIAELEKEHRKVRTRVEELEQQLAAAPARPAEPVEPVEQNKRFQQEEFEAMRAELAARKSLVKTLRSDAERSKTLEKELAENREAMATMKKSIDRNTKTMAELRRSADSWEQKYRKLLEGRGDQPSRSVQMPRGDQVLRNDPPSRIAASHDSDETKEMPMIDPSHTIVIDMAEPLRQARDERLRKYKK